MGIDKGFPLESPHEIDLSDGLKILDREGKPLVDLSGDKKPKETDPDKLTAILQEAVDKAIPPEGGQKVTVKAFADGVLASLIQANPDAPFQVERRKGEWWDERSPEEKQFDAVVAFALAIGKK